METENKQHYITATAIVVKDGKFLIAKRSPNEKAFPNRWTVPGGKLERTDYSQRKPDAGELWYNVLEDVVKREIMEEVGIEVKNIRYITSLAFIRPDQKPGVIVSFMANYKNGDIKLDSSLIQWEWVDIVQAKEFDLIEGIYDELQLVYQFLQTGKMETWKKND